MDKFQWRKSDESTFTLFLDIKIQIPK
jgi:hypothetical protein